MSSNDELVQKLRDLGITDRTARFALSRTNNNVEQAAEYVFSGRAGKDESDDLILAALGRGRTSSSSVPASGNATPTQARPAAGAIATLGLRAAGIANPQQATPSTSVQSSSTPAATTAAKPNKSLLVPSKPIGSRFSKSQPRSRSPSPFFRVRKAREERQERSPSPDIVALRKDSLAADSDVDGLVNDRGRGGYRPRSSDYDSPDSSGGEEADSESGVKIAEKPVEKIVVSHDHGDDDDEDDDDHHHADDEDDLWNPETFFDEETEKNTTANAFYADPSCDDSIDPETKRDNFDVYGEDVEQDLLGEGPNVVVPHEPLFAKPADKVHRSARTGLELATSRPMFTRDRCTIQITQGDPDAALEDSGKRMRRYVVLSDLSEESRYAVEWAIGTVARDGDEVFLISVNENEDKVDPKNWSQKDSQHKMKVQKERQTTALLLVRQVTGLLERTRLNVTVTCQAIHAQNARHMLLDVIDFLEPTLVIVGSRGLGQLKGILLGSTSHYLVQKSSVPVMVARRRLRRALRHTNPEDLRRSARVSLASANIEKTAPSKQEDDILDAAEDDDDPEHDDKHHDSHDKHIDRHYDEHPNDSHDEPKVDINVVVEEEEE
ncbi:hypothetical protein CspeluHIS016_0105710 [Cutaneotrichosporon spelunceum]|uniref:UBA domain-containing protein n=1 Tax=Cutaneotrichosporon spelunceum TaxID=1672016 RepID=A0AAD3TNL4_9TREE|nr:hypothetical protein CspeluHIS016_0105710 [Cutaneotrichosporon spelunceum]